MVKNQIERLKKDYRLLERYEQKMINEDRLDCIKGIIKKKEFLKDHIEQLMEAA